jgi:isopentenyl-diphosphate delta-isomerase
MRCIKSIRTFSTLKKYAHFDISQTKLFNEDLILVDEKDNLVGKTTKLNGHLKETNNKYPHRAFSVFLFNHENKMLLQKRSNKKVTFPNLWSNTCCSHPIYTESELETKDNRGIKLAASRRMEYELRMGNVKDYFLFEKVLYRADSDSVFEEYECKHF